MPRRNRRTEPAFLLYSPYYQAIVVGPLDAGMAAAPTLPATPAEAQARERRMVAAMEAILDAFTSPPTALTDGTPLPRQHPIFQQWIGMTYAHMHLWGEEFERIHRWFRQHPDVLRPVFGRKPPPAVES